MAFYDALTERLQLLKKLSPRHLRILAHARLSALVTREISRSRERVDELSRRYPSADVRELAQRLIDGKKGLASMVGGVSGVFGLFSVPADLLVTAWLELVLLVDVATLYKVNLKSERARAELLDLYGYAHGIGPLQRSGPKVMGRLAGKLLERSGLGTLGKAVPLAAAPLSAYMNSQHLQRIGEEAVRYYDGWDKAHAKTQRASGI
ncbi:MAG: hypothetical protein ACOZIN_19535 [Myxococcota bacterium]